MDPDLGALVDLVALDRVNLEGRADPEAQANLEGRADLEGRDRVAPEDTNRADPEDTNRAAQGGMADMGLVDLANRADRGRVGLADSGPASLDLEDMMQADRGRAHRRLRDRALEDRAVRDLGQNRVHLGRTLPDPGRPALNRARPPRMRAHPHRIRAHLPVPTHPAEETHRAAQTHLAGAIRPGEATQGADTEGRDAALSRIQFAIK